MWKLDWFFNEIHLSCFILLNFSLLKLHEPILQPEIKCIGKQQFTVETIAIKVKQSSQK